MNSMWDTWNTNRVEVMDEETGEEVELGLFETQDYETLALNFAIMFYGLLNFEAPAVNSDVAATG